jgi:hypothetical protein
MMLPRKTYDWQGLWADMLKGVGTGLLEHDGSRAAQAALAGLKVFDAAQERRQRRSSGGLAEQLSDAELAHLLALEPEQQQAIEEEFAEADQREQALADHWRPKRRAGEQTPDFPRLAPPNLSPPARRQPMSVSPFAGWSLGSVLPFGSDGQLNLPTFRR